MNEAKRRLLTLRVMSDVAATQTTIVAGLADRTQIFAELSHVAMTATELSVACAIPARQAQAILETLAASEYVDFDPATQKYSLSPEQRSLFADESDPMFYGGGIEFALALARDDRDARMKAIARSSRAKFSTLVSRRLGQSLAGAKRFVEIGCGEGAVLIEIARQYPNLRALGIDHDSGVIARARAAAMDRVEFVAGDATLLEANSCDVVLCLEVLHEIAEPAEVARAVFRALRPGGVWLLVEPCGFPSQGANERRLLASLAALHCLPASGYAAGALGPLASVSAYEKIFLDAGFQMARVDREGPIHVIIEAQKSSSIGP